MCPTLWAAPKTTPRWRPSTVASHLPSRRTSGRCGGRCQGDREPIAAARCAIAGPAEDLCGRKDRILQQRQEAFFNRLPSTIAVHRSHGRSLPTIPRVQTCPSSGVHRRPTRITEWSLADMSLERFLSEWNSRCNSVSIEFDNRNGSCRTLVDTEIA